MMSSYGIKTVNQTATVAVDASAENGAQINRGGNLDSSFSAGVNYSGISSSASKADLLVHARHSKNERFSFVFLSSALQRVYTAMLAFFTSFVALFEREIYSVFLSPYLLILRSNIAQQTVSPALYNFPSRHAYSMLSYRWSCIPLLLYSYGFLSFSQAEHFRNVQKFSDLPLSLRMSILRHRRSAILVRVSFQHVENLLAAPTTGPYELISLRILLNSTADYLATPYSTAESKPTMEFSTPSVPALGGARAVLTQLPTSARAAGLSKKWSPHMYPTQAVDQRVVFDVTARGIKSLRENNFVRSFPENLPQPRQPTHFSELLTSILAGRLSTSTASAANTVPTQFNRSWQRQPIVDRTLAPQHAGLASVLEGIDYSKQSLAAAEQAVSINRFLDTRGNRIIPRWEADQWNRWSGITSLYSLGQSDRSYLQIAYRLLSRYYFSLLAEELSELTPLVTTAGTATTLTGLTTLLAPPTPPIPGQPIPLPVNPEAALFTQAAFSGLKTGTAQLVDAEGLSEDELIELISAIVPLESANIPLLSTAADPAETFFAGPTRYTYDNTVNEVFIHFGNNAIPDLAQIATQVHRVPQGAQILSVLRYLAMRHGAAQDIDDALEILMARIVLYTNSTQLRGLRNNAPVGEYINSDGHYEMHLPLAKTGSAYFDSFMVPHAMTGDLPAFASLPARSVINNGVLFAQARAAALNWAAAAWSMSGRSWVNSPGRENNSYVRNHIDVFLRKYSSDILNLWTSNHNNALAFHVGWSLSATARSTEANVVVNWWNDYHSPTLTNAYLELWQVECLPSHQVLPWDDRETPSTVSWPSNTPFPVHDAYSFSSHLHVQVARDTPAEVGRTFMGDGGAIANAQHFAAVGTIGGFRYEDAANAPKISIARWRQRHAFQFPVAPASQAPVWMAEPGSPFADFLSPGSMNSHNVEANVAYSYGLTTADDITALDRRYTAQLWFDAARQVPKRSLMVNYVSPFPDRREFSSLQDYSIIVWEKENAYAGMSLVPVDFSPVSIADYKPAANLTFPSLTRPSAVDTSDIAKNPRVASSKRAPRAAASDILARLKEFNSPPPPPPSPEPKHREPAAELSYEAKYPIEEAQVPSDFRFYQPVVEEDRVHVEPADAPDAYDRLSKQQLKLAIENNMQLLAKIQNSPILGELDLDAERKRREDFQKVESARNERIQRRASFVPFGPTRPRPVLTPRAPAVKRPQVHGKLPPTELRHAPVEINDAAAEQVQRQISQLGRPASPRSTTDPFGALKADKAVPGTYYQKSTEHVDYDSLGKEQLPQENFGHTGADVSVQDGIATDSLAKN
ncbi:hypothetical protein [Botrytis cinerea RNA virus 1]|uniref:Uncharacterized protein n=1 Tax=Botrytis cinerea RNA virus 1 TaxID=1568973 RepID=A0A0A7DSJ8_9VIRU|nr:hypothetical protein [Botrytis cinerea RNA virus 1]AIW58874.1 hypothetical protein [Botrytis cinerea RNA virus 1]